MKISVQAKQLKKRGNLVASVPVELDPVPVTGGQLVEMLVRDSVAGFNRRMEQDTSPVLSSEEMDSLAQVGKIGFGLAYGKQKADPDRAVEVALEGFRDGLFRVFVGEGEIETPETPLQLQEGDRVTIVRLVMLTGGFF